VQPELPAPEVEATRRRAARTGGAATKPIDDETKAARTRDEVRILRQARRAVSTDPARAWALVRQLESEYADGLMVEEREAVAIEVLAALGRDDEARQRGQTFLQRYPASPSADRVRQVIRKRAPTP
jgi:hypothetical protein